MSGVKGRSGPRARSIGRRRRDIVDKAWELVANKLFGVGSVRKDKLSIAHSMVLRSMPQVIEGEGFDNRNIVQILSGLSIEELRVIATPSVSSVSPEGISSPRPV